MHRQSRQPFTSIRNMPHPRLPRTAYIRHVGQEFLFAYGIIINQRFRVDQRAVARIKFIICVSAQNLRLYDFVAIATFPLKVHRKWIWIQLASALEVSASRLIAVILTKTKKPKALVSINTLRSSFMHSISRSRAGMKFNTHISPSNANALPAGSIEPSIWFSRGKRFTVRRPGNRASNSKSICDWAMGGMYSAASIWRWHETEFAHSKSIIYHRRLENVCASASARVHRTKTQLQFSVDSYRRCGNRNKAFWTCTNCVRFVEAESQCDTAQLIWWNSGHSSSTSHHSKRQNAQFVCGVNQIRPNIVLKRIACSSIRRH